MDPQDNRSKPTVPGGLPDGAPDANQFFHSTVAPHLREMSVPVASRRRKKFSPKISIAIAVAVVMVVGAAVLTVYAAGKSKSQYSDLQTLTVSADPAENNAAYSVQYPRQFTELNKSGAARAYGLLDAQKRVLGAIQVTPQYLGDTIAAATGAPTLEGLKDKTAIYDSLRAQLAISFGGVKLGDFKDMTTASGQKGVTAPFTYALLDGTPMSGTYVLVPGKAHFYVLQVLVRQSDLSHNQLVLNKVVSSFSVDK